MDPATVYFPSTLPLSQLGPAVTTPGPVQGWSTIGTPIGAMPVAIVVVVVVISIMLIIIGISSSSNGDPATGSSTALAGSCSGVGSLGSGSLLASSASLNSGLEQQQTW